MAERKFRFVSPGVFINEIDNSQLPNDLPDVGPIIVGRAERGPAMRPVRVGSPSEFVDYFGNPIPGGRGDDVWRDGNYVGPTYGAYAAMAYLRAGVGPVTYMRLLGAEHPEATSNYAGWDTGDQTTPGTTHATNGGAYGLFLFDSGSNNTNGEAMQSSDVGNGRLAAVFYTNAAHVSLSGSDALGTEEQGSIGFIKATAAGPEFTAVIEDSGDAATAENALDTTDISAGGSDVEFTILIPTTAGGQGGTAVNIKLDFSETSPTGGSDEIVIGINGLTDAQMASDLIDAINGTTNAQVAFATSGNGQEGIQGITAAQGSSDTQITLTVNTTGEDGNLEDAISNVTEIVDVRSFTGGASDTSVYKTSFNFDRNSSKHIRKVFNTNPQLGNAQHTDTSAVSNLGSKYWLGETFERWGTDHIDTTEYNYGIILPLHNGQATDTANNNFGKKRRGFADPETGWIFSQNTSTTYSGFDAQTNTQKLFKLKALNHGEWASRNLKISITDLKASVNDLDSYGTFTVLVRRASDSDNVPEIIEQFTNCNLNPSSENYLAKKIGDRYMIWDTTQGRLRQYGEFNNMSKYVYVEMNASVADGTVDPSLLPFGFYGPIKPKDFAVSYGQTETYASGTIVDTGETGVGTVIQTYATGSSANTPSWVSVGGTLTTNTFIGGAANLTASFLFPVLPARVSASDGGLSNPKDAFFGIQTALGADSKRFDPGYADYLRSTPGSSAIFVPSTTDGAVGNAMEYSFIFTLDDISGSQGVHMSGSAAGSNPDRSLNAVSGSYTGSLDAGYNKFTAPLWGGFDGVDITEMEPFNNVDIASDSTEKTSYAYYTVKRAIDTVADPEFVEGNILSVPGIWQPLVTDQVIAVAESRADCLGVIDIENVYTPNTETTNNFQNRVGSVTTAANTLSQRRINSSYACTFYPWVQIRDDISNATLWVPPSVVAIGTFASSEARAELWFAPAGFTRGGLSTGAGGFSVLSCTERLRREDRDDLYTANINPIATFPSEGIVVFGQKTLQVTPSALDRINVRRLMIFLKKRVSRIASGILFDQNVQTTWTRFKSEVDKFLGSVQARLGLTEFRVILDESTTTPDLVDRNILYAKIFLKPARAIEFIAIDFFITRTGASFDD